MGRTINAIAIVALVLGLSACIEDRRPGGATGGHADQDSEADAGNDEPDAWADDDSGESIPPPCFVCYSVPVSSMTLRNVPVECSGMRCGITTTGSARAPKMADHSLGSSSVAKPQNATFRYRKARQ